MIVSILYFIALDHDVSDIILHTMDQAAKVSSVPFEEDQIDGGMEEIPADNDEDMVVAVCYIAEALTFGRTIEFENLDLG